MDLKQALTTLAANAQIAGGSFVHALHERHRFEPPLFWELYSAMTLIAQAPPKSRGRLARRHAGRVHRSILMLLIWHLNPHDGYRIRRLPARALQAYLDRLDWVFEPVIEGKSGYGASPHFGDGLSNPQQVVLDRAVRGRRKR